MSKFDYNNIDWDFLVSDRETQRFIEIIQGSLRHVNELAKGNSFPDLAFVKKKNMARNLDVGRKLANTDHKEIRFSINGRQMVQLTN